MVAWYFVGGALQSVAFASLPLSAVSQVIRRYGPKSVILESRRDGGWEAGKLAVEGVESLWYVPPNKRGPVSQVPRNAYVGRLSPLVHRAFSLGFTALFGRGGYKLRGKLSLHEISPEWLSEHAKY